MITPDELEILRKPEVQGYIVGTLKYVVPGDVLFHIETEQTFTVGKVNETEFQIIPDLQGYEWQLKEHLRFFLRIPDCISRDSERPERGLVGMLDDSWEIINPCLSDKWMVRCLAEQMDQGPDALAYTQNIAFSGAPRLALLKALEWQIEGRKG